MNLAPSWRNKESTVAKKTYVAMSWGLALMAGVILLPSWIFTGCDNATIEQGINQKKLKQGEFSKYDELLKNNGQLELKTIAGVYDDHYKPPRVSLMCVNNRGEKFQVDITGSTIVRIIKF